MSRNPSGASAPPQPEVVAAGLDDAGAGVGVVDGAEYHVPDLLPGERARVAIEHKSPHGQRAWARIVRRTSPPSPDRVEPACPAAGRCGGCAWQHLAYPAQLVAKRARVVAALATLGDAAPAVAAPVPSPRPLGYRNKGKYVVADGRHGLVLGAYAPRSHKVVDSIGCRVVTSRIDDVAIRVRRAAAAAGLRAYDERHRDGELRYVIVRSDDRGGALVVLVVTSATRAEVLAAAAAAVAAYPPVRGVVAMRNDRTDGAIVTDDVTVLHGVGALIEDVAGCPVEVGAGEFLQINRDQAAALHGRAVDLALDGLAEGAVAVDLYAGLGAIALGLARRGARVTAIELDPGAVAALRRAAAAGGLADRVTAIAGDAAGVPAGADVVVVDPPRKGLAAPALAALIAAAPPRIVYVSCGPDALARDLAALHAAGYRIADGDVAEPYDLMPGTAQIEVVLRLTRPTTS
ncbi:MAG: 23S rRNA (uracil(1939)-C(5))-methyltransferase RlmD [Kofleriaceae bacterium]|nr:23S rRNA (uracil(1939)-C(5))-methyltransferase RlmD [Kofleriaceae bacterium]